jgi:hypothetical protein
MTKGPLKDPLGGKGLPKSFQEQVAAVADATNAEAMVSLSPVQIKRKRPPEEDINTMMDHTMLSRYIFSMPNWHYQTMNLRCF